MTPITKAYTKATGNGRLQRSFGTNASTSMYQRLRRTIGSTNILAQKLFNKGGTVFTADIANITPTKMLHIASPVKIVNI